MAHPAAATTEPMAASVTTIERARYKALERSHPGFAKIPHALRITSERWSNGNATVALMAELQRRASSTAEGVTGHRYHDRTWSLGPGELVTCGRTLAEAIGVARTNIRIHLDRLQAIDLIRWRVEVARGRFATIRVTVVEMAERLQAGRDIHDGEASRPSRDIQSGGKRRRNKGSSAKAGASRDIHRDIHGEPKGRRNKASRPRPSASRDIHRDLKEERMEPPSGHPLEGCREGEERLIRQCPTCDGLGRQRNEAGKVTRLKCPVPTCVDGWLEGQP